MSKAKNTYDNQQKKTLKCISKLESMHNIEIKNLQEKYETRIDEILNKISKEYKIPIGKLLICTHEDNKKSLIIDKNYSTKEEDAEDAEDEENIDSQKSVDCSEDNMVLTKITINGKKYYADEKKNVVYKGSKSGGVTKVGNINNKGNYILD